MQSLVWLTAFRSSKLKKTFREKQREAIAEYFWNMDARGELYAFKLNHIPPHT